MKQVHFITELFDKYDGRSLQAYLNVGGFASLQKTIEIGSEAVLTEIDASGLQGRGGAAYPTGKSCGRLRRKKRQSQLVVCNADEGEPNFKDRELLKCNIYQVIEGWSLPAFARSPKKALFMCGKSIPICMMKSGTPLHATAITTWVKHIGLTL